MADEISLVVGLGNPGPEYDGTRHNAGADFVLALARAAGASLQPDSKFYGLSTRIQWQGHELRLLIPTTFMNRSGQSVAALARFYRIPPESMLVAHDELDIEPGTARFKKDGGHGGHNGLRDIISSLGNRRDFYRLRIGIGHPGHASRVTGYVLKAAPAADASRIDAAIDEAIAALPLLLDGDMTRAMTRLHSFTAA